MDCGDGNQNCVQHPAVIQIKTRSRYPKRANSHSVAGPMMPNLRNAAKTRWIKQRRRKFFNDQSRKSKSVRKGFGLENQDSNAGRDPCEGLEHYFFDPRMRVTSTDGFKGSNGDVFDDNS
jgi:hypothetical protein